MRNVKWLAAAGLLASATGCVETNGYPATGYGGYPSSSSYGSSYGTYARPAYYQPAPRYVVVPVASPPQVVTQTRYVLVPTPGPRPFGSRSSWGNRDDDRDGIPNRYDRDRNNDGIPDRLQHRRPPG